MDTEHSASSTLPWIWVIEALAKMKEVDMSVLTDLVAKTPEITDDVGKDARNSLLLRCLEDFQEQQLGNLNAPFTGPVPNIEIDQLTDHEDVRQILLRKFSVFTVNERSDLNSDIQTLIQNKRRSLPKCAIERLNNVIWEGRPILESLKKSSRLSTSDLSENKTSLNGSLNNHEAWSNGVPPKVKQRVHSGQVISMQGNLPLYQSAYSNQSLQDPIKINHVSSRCKRIDPTSKDKLPEHHNNGNSPKDERDSQLHISKKAKHAVSMNNEATDGLLSALVSNELSENLVELDSKTTVVSKVDKLDGLRSEDSHDHGSGKNNFSKEEDNDSPIGPSVCSLHDRTKMECVDDGETEGDSDGFDDEKIDIEMEKQRFLKSQCTFSEDTLSTTQKTELNLCIKCNRDGQLLICSTRTCTIGVHPSCLGYDAPSDDCRDFYCPFCSHSNAISAYLEAKKEQSLARKSLIAFERFVKESQPKINSKRYDWEGKDQYTHYKQQCGANKKHRQQKESLESCIDGNQPSEEGRMTSRGSFGVMVAPIEEEHVRSECATEHNLRDEHITKKDGYQQADSNLCKELVVYVEQEKEQYDDIDEVSQTVVSASNICIQYTNQPGEKIYPSIPLSRRKMDP